MHLALLTGAVTPSDLVASESTVLRLMADRLTGFADSSVPKTSACFGQGDESSCGEFAHPHTGRANS
jgi:hypothetical protein